MTQCTDPGRLMLPATVWGDLFEPKSENVIRH